MKAKITATAPTAYQYSSLRAFGLDYKPVSHYPLTETKHFDTFKEARQYLKDLAHQHYWNDKQALRRNYGGDCLTIDAVTATIERA